MADHIAAGDVLDVAPPESGEFPAGGDVAEIVAAADRLVAAVRRSHALEATVHELFEAMSSHLRLDYLSYEALYRVIDHTGAAGGAIVLVGDGPPEVVASVELGIEGERLAALMASVPAVRGPAQLEPLEDGVPMVAVPFVGDSGPLGVVLLLGVGLDGEIARLLALLARALGFAVSNALAHAAAETQAATDVLTGCQNRRAGLDALAQAARLAAHGGAAVGAMMIDLDHFKQINDRHGHQVGDDVLLAAGAAIAAGMRDRDIVMRYGGEEFLVAIAGADEVTLAALAGRVSHRIRDLEVPDGAGGAVALTASVGAAVWAPSDTVESLIARADRALYAAKAAGRDRVVLQHTR
ncbi:MAG: diguanylate cyclase [Solirubrobacteraceae bacterium]